MDKRHHQPKPWARPNDGIFTTWVIQNTSCRYLSGLNAIGDHQCLWIDIPETNIFGTTMPITTAKVQRLKKEDPRIIKKYLEHPENQITQHNLLQQNPKHLKRINWRTQFNRGCQNKT